MRFFIEKTILEYAPRTRIAIIQVEGAKVGFGHTKLDDMRLRVVNRLRDDVGSTDQVKLVPQIAGVDQLLGKFDADMRRTVTLSETVLRKILSGGPLPVENDASDAATLLSLYYKLPVLLADPTSLRGDVGLVIGRSGRSFEGLQGEAPIRTEGRLFLADEIGYFACLTAAGKRAMVSERSKNLLLFAVFPDNVGDSIVRDFIRRGGNWLTSLSGGRVTQEGMVGEPEATE